ncbi:MAG: RNA-binding S4 domain-containing protein [Arthrobacter sp.]|uniref:RNA-binding S4 domain-containing protein n=1 Tax=unclassified Arthrobacter TaxID=235627 RepID=UPI00264D989C|nr:RNA-binding S4 domain-containing protein [Micrococcaceae bacterium]MDN5824113.1 RNA-binding S4 domain-containing protein [Micrococcaceae bacterium]MDN5880675.1 RNA-binding S4 domain-containing protein [Micrococcaceae bacterium]MDN5906636.1 RNA-binding S4 domain-containing protein [Micrococcaceae bacterium]MDN6170884.1 RNA-binding S4 domain-containing protein [Micrococcaceae bacterium]
MTAEQPRPISIRDDSIRLGQLLKLASLAEDGFHAKELIENGMVQVNGEIETRRGRQLKIDDVIALADESVIVTSE